MVTIPYASSSLYLSALAMSSVWSVMPLMKKTMTTQTSCRMCTLPSTCNRAAIQTQKIRVTPNSIPCVAASVLVSEVQGTTAIARALEAGFQQQLELERAQHADEH
jgi:hypothetical protein